MEGVNVLDDGIVHGGAHQEGDLNDSMQCNDHPYKQNPVGGICVFCLQDKLDKLVSSSFLAAAKDSASIPDPAFVTVQTKPSRESQRNARNSRIPFLSAKTKMQTNAGSSSLVNDNMVFKRSKSSTNKRNGFWSFLYFSKRNEKIQACNIITTKNDEGSMGKACNERKVVRSRSLGCGNRSFSSDLSE